ncbi:AEC family transporter [Sphingopyxis granuli]|uniref:AEC family transporter n=1 Tax=Sphingopyxis granuli TaxID=267128 RepID=UPI00301D1469
MIAVLATVIPIFALIFAGWISMRLGIFGPHATRELNRFVVHLALPALLFGIVANAEWHEIWQPGFIASFGLGCFLVFGIALGVHLARGGHLADAAIDGLNASYANTGFVGFPLALAVVGPASLAPTLVATIITVCVLFAVALLLVEASLHTSLGPRRLLKVVLISLIKNPLLVAPVLGAIVLVSGVPVPGPMDSFLKLLGTAASPCALVALGLFLAGDRPAPTTSHLEIGWLVGMKLLLQPAATWVLAAWVFRLSPPLTHLAVLLAALPTGTGSFMIAEYYQRRETVTAQAVTMSTIVSVVSLTLYLTLVP